MKKALLATIVMISVNVNANSVNSTNSDINDDYIGIGYGSKGTVNFELGSTSEGVGYFFGAGFNTKRPERIGSEGASYFPSSWHKNLGTHKSDDFNFYGGLNYTVKTGDFKHTVGGGLDLIYGTTFTNWYTPTGVLGNNGYYYVNDEVRMNGGGVANYVMTYDKVSLGVTYRTYNSEMIGNIAYNF